jgi:hypothetical protein
MLNERMLLSLFYANLFLCNIMWVMVVLDRRQCDFLPDDALRVMGLGASPLQFRVCVMHTSMDQ